MGALLGMGAAPMGGVPFGYGSPASGDPNVGTIFNAVSGGIEAQPGRYIDPKTKQYVYDANGRALGMPTINQLVQLRLTMAKKSSAIIELGQELALLQDIDDGFIARATATVRAALADLIAQNLISLLSVSLTRFAQSGVFLDVKWKDLSTGEEQLSSI